MGFNSRLPAERHHLRVFRSDSINQVKLPTVLED